MSSVYDKEVTSKKGHEEVYGDKLDVDNEVYAGVTYARPQSQEGSIASSEAANGDAMQSKGRKDVTVHLGEKVGITADMSEVMGNSRQSARPMATEKEWEFDMLQAIADNLKDYEKKMTTSTKDRTVTGPYKNVADSVDEDHGCDNEVQDTERGRVTNTDEVGEGLLLQEGERLLEGGSIGFIVTNNEVPSYFKPLIIDAWQTTGQKVTSQKCGGRTTAGTHLSSNNRNLQRGDKREGAWQTDDAQVVHMEDIDNSPQRGPRVWYVMDDMSDLKLGRVWEGDKCWESACEYKEEAVERNQSRCREKELEDKHRQESVVDKRHNTTEDSRSSTTADKERKQEVHMEDTDNSPQEGPRRDTVAAHKIGRSSDSDRGWKDAYEYKGETGERNQRSRTGKALKELRRKEKVGPEGEREELRGETPNLTTLDSTQRGGDSQDD
eukprot:gene33550-43356_t